MQVERGKKGVMFLICCGNMILRRASKRELKTTIKTRLTKNQTAKTERAEEVREIREGEEENQ